MRWLGLARARHCGSGTTPGSTRSRPAKNRANSARVRQFPKDPPDRGRTAKSSAASPRPACASPASPLPLPTPYPYHARPRRHTRWRLRGCWPAAPGRASARSGHYPRTRSGRPARPAARPHGCCRPSATRSRCPGTGGPLHHRPDTAPPGPRTPGSHAPPAPRPGWRRSPAPPPPGRPRSCPSRPASSHTPGPGAPRWYPASLPRQAGSRLLA